MRIALLDKLTGEWAKPWIIIWFTAGVAALFTTFWRTTEHAGLDWFYFGVSIIGLLCVAALSFRRNIAGNGFGMAATAGESYVQWTAGSVGLMLTPIYNFFTHLYGLYYWSKNTDGDGNMIPKSANKWIWLVTIAFIVVGLLFFNTINAKMAELGILPTTDDKFYWLNVAAFVVAITAQTTMILRYSLNWWLWLLSNFIWLFVNLMSENYIFAIQTLVYQVNAVIGLYEWYRSESQHNA